ncbi:MAG: hypothetical protein JSR93_04130 [Verrucomicrobia bacterium]|nr:hypothetical protein [Verrucomicrobiota bacterium]
MPLYNAWKPLHLSQRQEIKACAELLLELAKKPLFSLDNDGNLMLESLTNLHSFSKRLHQEDAYHPLLDIKNYLNKTLISYAEKDYRNISIPLDRAVMLLGSKSNHSPSPTLLKAVIDHIREEMRPAGPLYLKLIEVCRHQ